MLQIILQVVKQREVNKSIVNCNTMATWAVLTKTTDLDDAFRLSFSHALV